MRTIAVRVTATIEEQNELERWIRAQGTPQGVVRRARIVLATLAGITSKEIGRKLRVSQPTIRKWQRRFAQGGLESLTQVAAGRGRKPRYRAAKVEAIVRATQKQKPTGQTHWSRRTLAAAVGVSASTVHRIWDAHGLAPHRVKTFKVSRDPRFVEKLTDVVGLYLNPPERAIVLCVDEKSQIQALQRTQPGLPMKKGAVRHAHPRLYAPWDHDTLCRPRCPGRQGHRSMPAAPSPSGVFEVPAHPRCGFPPGQVPSSHRRQLRHPQASGGGALAQKPFPICAPLHADEFLLA
jgi:transposase